MLKHIAIGALALGAHALPAPQESPVSKMRDRSVTNPLHAPTPITVPALAPTLPPIATKGDEKGEEIEFEIGSKDGGRPASTTISESYPWKIPPGLLDDFLPHIGPKIFPDGPGPVLPQPAAVTSTVTVPSHASQTPAKLVVSTVIVVTSNAAPMTTVYYSTSTLSTITTTITSSASSSCTSSEEDEKPHTKHQIHHHGEKSKHGGHHSSSKKVPGVVQVSLSRFTYDAPKPTATGAKDRSPTWVTGLGPAATGPAKCDGDDEKCPQATATVGNGTNHKGANYKKPQPKNVPYRFPKWLGEYLWPFFLSKVSLSSSSPNREGLCGGRCPTNSTRHVARSAAMNEKTDVNATKWAKDIIDSVEKWDADWLGRRDISDTVHEEAGEERQRLAGAEKEHKNVGFDHVKRNESAPTVNKKISQDMEVSVAGVKPGVEVLNTWVKDIVSWAKGLQNKRN